MTTFDVAGWPGKGDFRRARLCLERTTSDEPSVAWSDDTQHD
jgi:hypothetical protein